MVALSHKATGARVTVQKVPEQPPLMFQKYIKDTSNLKAKNNLQKFVSFMEIDEQVALSWIYTTRDEYAVKGPTLRSSVRFKETVKVNFDHFEELMRLKTIKDADELFDMNEALDIFKA